MSTTKFILGTANLGAEYGVTNPRKYNQEISRQVLSHALSRGIDTFDTASEYGVAEELLGKLLSPSGKSRIITKIPSRESYSYAYVSECLESSLMKLKQKNIYGLLFHDPEIHKKREVNEISKRLLDTGKIDHIGFSGYELNAILDAKEMNPNWTIFQVPENILDRRLINSKELAELAEGGNIFFVRSIFLQGLLLTKSSNLPEEFNSYQKIFQELQLLAESKNVTPLDLCISYASKIPWSSGLIVAAASIKQLDEILEFKSLEIEEDKLQGLPEIVLDPRSWSKLK
jgi:aryl-alcohol dehydrogenase-like predicted oxidoreductase